MRAIDCGAAWLTRMHACTGMQVTGVVMDDGRTVECSMVVAGVGAKPNLELVSGQLELLDRKPGGIVVRRFTLYTSFVNGSIPCKRSAGH